MNLRTYMWIALLALSSCTGPDYPGYPANSHFVRDVPERTLQDFTQAERDVFHRFQTVTDPEEKLAAGRTALAILLHRQGMIDMPAGIDFQKENVRISVKTWIELFGKPEDIVPWEGQTVLTYGFGGKGVGIYYPSWEIAVYTYNGYVVRLQTGGEFG